MKKYFFDFCGTLIKEQTHEQIKFFCLEKKYFFYFIKIFIPKKFKIKFDCYFLHIFDLHSEYSMWLSNKVTTTMSMSILEDLKKKDSPILVLTLADQKVVELFLEIHLGYKVKVMGSTIKDTLLPSDKKNVIKLYNDTVFFSDSLIDLPAMKVSNKVVMSEYSSPALIKYGKLNKFICVYSYE